MFKSIKNVLRSHIKNNLNTIWQWDKDDNNFICVYNEVINTLPIYTSQQLLDVLTNFKEESK